MRNRLFSVAVVLCLVASPARAGLITGVGVYNPGSGVGVVASASVVGDVVDISVVYPKGPEGPGRVFFTFDVVPDGTVHDYTFNFHTEAHSSRGVLMDIFAAEGVGGGEFVIGAVNVPIGPGDFVYETPVWDPHLPVGEFTIQVGAAPEPSSLVMGALGAAGLVVVGLRRRKA